MAISDPGHSHTVSQAAQPRPDKFTEINMRRMLASRMGWDLDPIRTEPAFGFCHPKKLNDEQAVVFVIHRNEALILYDDINLYPSDALVTSLRLLLS